MTEREVIKSDSEVKKIMEWDDDYPYAQAHFGGGDFDYSEIEDFLNFKFNNK